MTKGKPYILNNVSTNTPNNSICASFIETKQTRSL